MTTPAFPPGRLALRDSVAADLLIPPTLCCLEGNKPLLLRRRTSFPLIRPI